MFNVALKKCYLCVLLYSPALRRWSGYCDRVALGARRKQSAAVEQLTAEFADMLVCGPHGRGAGLCVAPNSRE